MLYGINRKRRVCGDICKPLIDLWLMIQNDPQTLADAYAIRWERLQARGDSVYYAIRQSFNDTRSPEDFLFLSRTCANGLIRFNRKGEFNSPFHPTRPGIRPETLTKILADWSARIQGVSFLAGDYESTTAEAKEGDLVYLDPPYFHTRGMYYGGLDYDRFFAYLQDLNERRVFFLLSFDGRRGETDYTVGLPKELYRRHVYICSGNSSFQQLFGRKAEPVYDSLYLNF